jgi:hypothetical protein
MWPISCARNSGATIDAVKAPSAFARKSLRITMCLRGTRLLAGVLDAAAAGLRGKTD